MSVFEGGCGGGDDDAPSGPSRGTANNADHEIFYNTLRARRCQVERPQRRRVLLQTLPKFGVKSRRNLRKLEISRRLPPRVPARRGTGKTTPGGREVPRGTRGPRLANTFVPDGVLRADVAVARQPCTT